MGLLDGRSALITGGARGQGRSHALTLAREGCDVILVDLCRQLETVPYPMSTPGQLQATVGEIEELDRRAIGIEADARDLAGMQAAVAREKQLKGWLRAKKVALIESVNPTWEDLSAE